MINLYVNNNNFNKISFGSFIIIYVRSSLLNQIVFNNKILLLIKLLKSKNK